MVQAIEQAREEAARRRRAADASNDAPEYDGLVQFAALKRAFKAYELIEPVRYGGQGAVYRARQRTTNRIVAIKVLHDGPFAGRRQQARFEREAELTSRLQHPHIVALYNFGRCRRWPYLALEFVEGLPADDFVVLHDLSPRPIVVLMEKVCRAVHHAHQNGIIHRDINPANILVDDAGEPHVLDFGLAHDVWSEGGRVTHTGQVLGTLPYLSPEQAAGDDREVDVRTDVYALGVVLYELLAGCLPYPVDGDWLALRTAILGAEPLPLRQTARQAEPHDARRAELNRDLEAVVQKMLAKRKEHRYQSAAAIADDLRNYLSGGAVGALADFRFYRARKFLRRHRFVVAVAAVLTLVLGISAAAVSQAWLAARGQRDRARTGARLAYDLFEQVLAADERIGPLAGGIELRSGVLQRLSQTVPEIAALTEDEILRSRVAERLGDLALTNGDRAAARAHYRAFREDVEREAGDAPNSVEAQCDRVRAFRKLAAVEEEPISLFERGEQLAEALLQRDPTARRVRLEFCELQHAYGEHLFSLGEQRAALAHFERVLALAPSTDERRIADSAFARIGACALSRVGQIHLATGDARQGRQDATECIRQRKLLVEAYPANTAIRHELTLSYLYLGTVERDAGNLDVMADLWRAGIEQGAILCMLGPTIKTWKQDLYALQHRLAEALLNQGRVDTAQEHCAAAVALARDLANRYPEDDAARSTLAFAHQLQGRAHYDTGAFEEARAEFERTVALREELAETDRSAAGEGRLASAYEWLARAVLKLGDRPGAIGYRECVLGFREDLVLRYPDMVTLRLDLVTSKANLAAAWLGAADADSHQRAAAVFLEAADDLQALEAAGVAGGNEYRLATCRSAIRTNLELALQKLEGGADQQAVHAIQETICALAPAAAARPD